MIDQSTIRCDIALRDRPLLVCDVDEVVLEFVTPLMAFLQTRGFELRAQSYRLWGNIYSLETGNVAEKTEVKDFMAAFFNEQEKWQTPAKNAAETLAKLADDADIVFLTAMPPHHHGLRRELLNKAGMPYPMIATMDAKGPEVASLHGGRDLPLAFIDDIFVNLHSVRDHVPNTLLVNMMANDAFRALAPDPGEGVASAANWIQAKGLIRDHFGLSGTK